MELNWKCSQASVIRSAPSVILKVKVQSVWPHSRYLIVDGLNNETSLMLYDDLILKFGRPFNLIMALSCKSSQRLGFHLKMN